MYIRRSCGCSRNSADLHKRLSNISGIPHNNPLHFRCCGTRGSVVILATNPPCFATFFFGRRPKNFVAVICCEAPENEVFRGFWTPRGDFGDLDTFATNPPCFATLNNKEGVSGENYHCCVVHIPRPPQVACGGPKLFSSVSGQMGNHECSNPTLQTKDCLLRKCRVIARSLTENC